MQILQQKRQPTNYYYWNIQILELLVLTYIEIGLVI